MVLKNVKQKAFLFVFIVTFILMPKVCLAGNVNVNLIWKFPDPHWLEIEVRQGTYVLRFDQSKLSLSSGESIKIGCSSIARFLLRGNQLSVVNGQDIKLAASNNGVFRVREPGKDWVSYRGDLKISAQGTGWTLLNTLDREDYLKGVVPIEMSNAWAAKGFEALKAQAVAARTYLLKNADKNGTITDSPDIHQAYWGKTAEGEASRAVDETKGEVLVDITSRQPISIFYSSHNGGYSEETEHVWENHDPHYTSEPDSFSEGIGGFTDSWNFYIAADILGSSFSLAPIRKVNLKKYESGRVYEVELVDWLGKEKIITGGAFVRKFYPVGQSLSSDSFLGRLFRADYIFPNGSDFSGIPGLLKIANPKPGPLLSRLKSSNEGLSSEERNFGVFVFEGHGWGHGVGMSQWGAYNMAMQGYSYQEILNYYYKNTALIKKP